MNKQSKWRILTHGHSLSSQTTKLEVFSMSKGAVVKFQIYRHGSKKIYAPGSREMRPSRLSNYLVKISWGHSCDFRITKFPFTTMTAMEESLVEMRDM